jgi:hypothetical protein
MFLLLLEFLMSNWQEEEFKKKDFIIKKKTNVMMKETYATANKNCCNKIIFLPFEAVVA